MKNKLLVYWCCQVGGWLAYGLSILLYSFTSNQRFTGVMYGRLVIGITFGFLFTQLLRSIILKFNLRPPMFGRKWWVLLTVFVLTALLYSIVNSVFVEWVHMYNPEIKVSVSRRTLYTFLSDTPVLVAWVSFYYLWHYIEINTNNTLDKVRLESLVKDLELKTIKSHINPHFIFNALNSIRALVDENPERARTAITQLSNILRSSMQAESLELAPLSRELDIIKDYLELEKVRFEERLNIEYDVDKDTLRNQVPPMMLQTLVENALKHGIGKLKEGGLIKISSGVNNNIHSMSVQNTGHLEEAYREDGFGIASTRSRLKLLYGTQASFELKEISDNLVEAKVVIPI